MLIPFFRVLGTEVNDIENAFDTHPGVRETRLVDSVEDEHLLRVEWRLVYDDVLTALAETEVPVLNATGTDQQWTFEGRGEDQTALQPFNNAVKSWTSRSH